MKKSISVTIPILFALFFIASCDFVQNANPELEPTSTTTGSSGITLSDSIISSNPSQRKVLVEDYTGHKCGNCPEAAIVLKNLETLYGSKVVAMAIHAGSFANVNANFPTSFTTTPGNDYNTFFSVSAQGNPNGMINRIGYSGGASVQVKYHTGWASEVAQQVVLPAKFQIKLKYSYNTGSLLLNTSVKIKSLANNTGIYKTVVLLTEDSIIAEQLDYSLPVGSQTNTNYEFDHVLRGAINSSWGDVMFASGAGINIEDSKTYSSYQIKSTFKPSHCSIIVYIYDADPSSPTYYEVLQTETIKLKK